MSKMAPLISATESAMTIVLTSETSVLELRFLYKAIKSFLIFSK